MHENIVKIKGDEVREIKLIIPEEFLRDVVSYIYSERVYETLFNLIDLLRTTPEMGSRNVPDSVIARDGNTVRKLVIESFEVFYSYEKEKHLVTIMAIVHQRTVR